MPADEPETAILFPGQGVGDESSRKLVAEVRPDLLALAKELLGADPFERIGDSTLYAQPAVYCASIAGFELLGRPQAQYFAGHSLGEIGAVVASGALDERTGLRVVVARGRIMEEAARVGPRGGMLAVGAERRRAESLARAHGLTLANENAPTQFVLSGPLAGIDGAAREAKKKAIRAKRLAVAGAFHTEAMRSAASSFRAALEGVEFRDVEAPAISCSTTRFLRGGVQDALADSLVLPVRWLSVMEKLRGLGATRYVDVGPGRVLAGLVRRTLTDVTVETATGQEPAAA